MAIDWQAIETMPPDYKDGRRVLLWDGELIDGRWERSHWEAYNRCDWDGDAETVAPEDVTHWADINSPDDSLGKAVSA